MLGKNAPRRDSRFHCTRACAASGHRVPVVTRIRAAFVAASLVCALSAATAQAQCRQALALGLDVSGSVDAREYRLQMGGLAAALSDPRVRHALLSNPAAPVELLVYEWSGPGDHTMILPWTRIATAADLDKTIAHLQAIERRISSPGTALGLAMQVGAAYLERRSDCAKLTLDISGDGKSNLGPRPQDVRAGLVPLNLTINGLVIGADAPQTGDMRQTQVGELSSYFGANVIMGDDAFVETAIGYEDYANAMTRKLIREIETLTLSALIPSDQ